MAISYIHGHFFYDLSTVEVVYALLLSKFPSRENGDILLSCKLADWLWFLNIIWVWQEYIVSEKLLDLFSSSDRKNKERKKRRKKEKKDR